MRVEARTQRSPATRLVALWLLAAFPGAPASATPVGDDEVPTGAAEEVTWSSHVNRILQENCEACHRPGQVAPFSLQSYEKARGWAQMIAAVVEEGRMPPWNASAEFDGVFANERRLTARDRDHLLSWIENGMPRGEPAQDPPPVDWPEGWRIGEPDAVFVVQEHRGTDRFGAVVPMAEEGFEVPREGVVEYQYFAVATHYAQDRWIQAIEVDPGAPQVVHHVLVFIDDPNATGTERQRQLSFQSCLAGAAPGDLPTFFPPGYAKRLPAGSTLIFQVHYTPNGTRAFDRSRIGMVFAEGPPEFEVVMDSVVHNSFRIPPGAPDHRVVASRELAQDVGVLSFTPHMHTRGKTFEYVAHYPDGSQELLLHADFDFNWQEAYVLPDPLLLPAGTRLECIGVYDNSDANPNNPDPSAWVKWGDQTFHEMFIGYFDRVRPLAE